MSGGHAPYIMPDGGKLRDYLRADRDSERRTNKSKQGRAKDDLWQQLQRNKILAGSEQELQEIRSIERAGHRRRQRWLNDKILRDMAGPLTARHMEAQFNPVPFGSYPPPSAFELAMQEPLWDHFRNIDPDKEAKVLQRWEQHNRHEQQQQHHDLASGPSTQHQHHAAAAADALERWSAVGRTARAALKKANVHSVLELEMQILDSMQQGGPDAELLLDLPDGFARLIVHGLAQFHHLVSSTRVVCGNKYVVISKRQQQQQGGSSSSPGQSSPLTQQHQQQIGAVGAASSSTSSKASPGSEAVNAAVDAGLQQAANASSGANHGADWLLNHDAITCSDVVMALRELGGSFDQFNLMRFMKTHVHGSTSDDFHMV